MVSNINAMSSFVNVGVEIRSCKNPPKKNPKEGTWPLSLAGMPVEVSRTNFP